MEPTEESILHRSLQNYFAGQKCDGLFLASLDHSPSEQLDGKKWHTSALVLSAKVEHSALARELAKVSNPISGKLTKWRKANPAYRKRFHANLMSALCQYPVLVFAISATEASIKSSEVHFAKELGATQYYRRHLIGGRTRVSIGPFVNARTGEQHTVDIAENQAPMVLFVAHFLRRMHQEVRAALSTVQAMHVTWNFLADKPPGDAGGAFDRAISMLLGLPNPNGSLRWGYFLQGDKVETDLLVDNIAGLLNEIMLEPQRYSNILQTPNPPSRGVFFWENWTTAS